MSNRPPTRTSTGGMVQMPELSVVEAPTRVDTPSIGTDSSNQHPLGTGTGSILDANSAVTTALAGTTNSSWRIGPGSGSGAVTVSFRNANTGTLTWTPSGSRTLIFPDTTDNVVTNNFAATLSNKIISGLSNTLQNLPAGSLSGVVPIANGGTNSSTALVNGRAMVSSGGSVVETARLLVDANAVTLAGGWYEPLSESATNVTMSSTAVTYVQTGNGTYTLPTAPANGRTYRITYYSDTNGSVVINAGGSDKIITFDNSSIRLGVPGSSVWLVYDSASTVWLALNLHRTIIPFTLTSASANNYLQPGGTGGSLSSAFGLANTSGTVVAGVVRISTASGVAATHTVDLQTTADWATSAALTHPVTASIATSGTAGVASGITVLTGAPSTAAQSWLVLKAITAITTTLHGTVELYTL